MKGLALPEATPLKITFPGLWVSEGRGQAAWWHCGHVNDGELPPFREPQWYLQEDGQGLQECAALPAASV